VDFDLPVPSQLTPRADFSADGFIAQIEGKGSRFAWEQRDLCPCRSATSRSDRVDCPICKGVGIVWTSVSHTVRGVLTRVKDAAKLFQDFGTEGHGWANLSLRWEHLPAWGDRFTLVDGILLRTELHERAAGTTDALDFPIKSVNMQQIVNGLTQTVVVNVRYLRTQTAGGVGEAAQIVRGTDFDVDEAGLVDWTKGDVSGTAPAVGEEYAVSYIYAPRFVVLEHPNALRQTDTRVGMTSQASQPLPLNVLCRLDWFPQEAA